MHALLNSLFKFSPFDAEIILIMEFSENDPIFISLRALTIQSYKLQDNPNCEALYYPL